MALKVHQQVPPRLALVNGWLFPGIRWSLPECNKIAHRHSLAIFITDSGYCREFRSGNQLCPVLIAEKNRCFASDFWSQGNRASWGLNRALLRGAVESQKRHRTHENKIGTSPPPNAQKRGILRAWKFSCRKNQKSHFSTKLSQPFSAIKLRVGESWTSLEDPNLL